MFEERGQTRRGNPAPDKSEGGLNLRGEPSNLYQASDGSIRAAPDAAQGLAHDLVDHGHLQQVAGSTGAWSGLSRRSSPKPIRQTCPIARSSATP